MPDQSKQTSYQRALARLLRGESMPKLGLSRMQAMLKALGNPERTFQSIHVAGTNGKGSTCAFLAELLKSRGDPVGLYTSPHLLCARERIRINGQLVSKELFCEAEEAVFKASESIHEKPTFFERMTAMAFWIFAEQGIRVAIIEVGLGGRLDATNVIQPKVSVITRIDLDHADILGDTLEKIAAEKAGIIKAGIPVVTGWQEASVMSVIQSFADIRSSSLVEVSEPCGSEMALQGRHQKLNAALAIAALQTAGISLSEGQIEQGLKSVVWPARFELIQENPSVIIDGAHNAAGMKALVQSILHDARWGSAPIFLVIGATQGHSVPQMARELQPIKSRIVQIFATQSRSPRALPASTLVKFFDAFAPIVTAEDVSEALRVAQPRALESGALIVIAGSLYVAGEARGIVCEMPRDPELPHF